MIRRSLPLLLLACTLIACGAVRSQTARTARLGDEITLAPGERVQFSSEQLEVQFIAVTEDSRCPRDTTCVWAGEVKVQLALRAGDGDAQLEVIAGQSAANGGWRVSVLSVRPERISSAPIPSGDYRVVLQIERSASGV